MGTHPIFESDFDCLTESSDMSDHEEEFDFDQAGSGASLTYPKQCSALRKNEFVMIKGHACKIVDMSTSKTRKHGHAKVHLVALDIFDGKKYEDICPLMDDTGETRDDLKPLEPELEKQIREKVDAGEDALVCVLKAIGQEMIMSMKNMAK